MINITKHALKRYVERFVSTDKEQVQDLINANKDLYEKELIKMFDHSRHLFSGKFNTKVTQASFWLADDIILVTDTEHTKIITLYRVEYGFSKSINKSILKDLRREHEVSKEKHNQVRLEIAKDKSRLLNDRDNLELEIEKLEKSLKATIESRNALNTYIKDFFVGEIKAREEMDLVAKKIVYSVNYKLEVLNN